MSGSLNKRPVGRCSECGGVVSLPISYMSVKRPVPTCERCGAVADEAVDLPLMPMIPPKHPRDWRNTHSCCAVV